MCRSAVRGNVLFIILMAIALFAALSFTVTDSMQSGGKAITDEQAKLYAGEIIEYGAAIKAAVQRLKISKGCANADLSFENDYVSGYEHSPVAEDKCKIFHPDGGKMEYREPSEAWLDTAQSANGGYQEWYFTSSVCVEKIGTTGDCWADGALDTTELMLFVPYLNQQTCLEINKSLGFSSIPQEWNNGYAVTAGRMFKGLFDNSFTRLGGDGAPLTDGSLSGCFEGGGTYPPSGTYHFFKVLVAR